MPNNLQISNYFHSLQDSICKILEKSDGHAKFTEDVWERAEGGGGRTRVIENGKILEKGGVAFSAVNGPLHPNMLKSMGIQGGEMDFFATGVSIVIHPKKSFYTYYSHECAVF